MAMGLLEQSRLVSCRRPGRAKSTQSSRRGSLYGDWSGRHAWLVRDATGEADRVPTGGRAQLVLDVSGGERSSESGMQHLSLL